MTESKQKRKTPLTTIAISQEYAQKLDEYIKGVALTRKDFVELAIDYFLRTGFDIRSEAFDLSPLERITDRLESSAKVMEQHNEGTEAAITGSPRTDRKATPSTGHHRPSCGRKGKGRKPSRRTGERTPTHTGRKRPIA